MSQTPIMHDPHVNIFLPVDILSNIVWGEVNDITAQNGIKLVSVSVALESSISPFIAGYGKINLDQQMIWDVGTKWCNNNI